MGAWGRPGTRFPLTLANNKPLKFSETTRSGTQSASLIGPAALAADVTWTMPAVTGTVVVAAEATVAALAADANDVAPGACKHVRVSASAAGLKITGFVAAAAGTRLYLENIGTTHAVMLAHEDAGSAAANRLQVPESLPWTVLRPGAGFWMVYDGTASRWRLCSGGQAELERDRR